jgi:hypothetical protein
MVEEWSMKVTVPVGVGELFDKITILEIKSQKFQDKDKLQNVQKELELLYEKTKSVEVSSELINDLKNVNSILWDVEDRIRIKEHKQEFDQEFIDLARKVYYTNDKRATIKKQINIITESNIIEEKEYFEYYDEKT